MRRTVVYQVLMFVIAVVLVAGCSSSPSPDVAEARDINEAEYDIVLPDASEAVNIVTGERDGVPARYAHDPRAVNSEQEPAPAEIADGADSDAPGGYQSLTADAADNSPGLTPIPLDQEALDDGATKRNGRRSDGDDPQAPLIVPKIAEQQDDTPLNNGRDPSARPIPEAQRVAVASADLTPPAVDNGRTSDAKPGTNEPAQPTTKPPTTKPTTASRKSLADLPKSIQSLDKDGDGQLGLYEWPREKLVEFKKLDSNKDGFLTPSELIAGQKKLSGTESQKADKEPAEGSKEEAKKEAPATTGNSSQPDDAKTADTTDDTETPDTTADEGESTDASSDNEKPEQGS